jgi:hypothetical protein
MVVKSGTETSDTRRVNEAEIEVMRRAASLLVLRRNEDILKNQDVPNRK